MSCHSTARASIPWSIAIVRRDRLGTDAVGLEVRAEPRDRLRRDAPQLKRAQPRQDVAVPVRRGRLERAPLEVRACLDLPPLGGELGERLPAGAELRQVVAAAGEAHLRVEVLGVTLAVERLAALLAVIVSPAHAEDGVRGAVAAAALASLDHDAPLTRAAARPAAR